MLKVKQFRTERGVPLETLGAEHCRKRGEGENLSLSTGRVLPRPYTFAEGRVIVQEMSDLLCLDLCKKGLLTESVTMYIGFGHTSLDRGWRGLCHIDYYGRIVPNHAKGTFHFRQGTNAASEISAGILGLYEDPRRVDRALLVRRIGLCANQVTQDSGTLQLDLFTDHEKQERETPSEEKQQELDKRLQFLWDRYCEYRSGVRDTGDGSSEKPFQPPAVTVRYFAESPEQAGRGQYRTVSGLVLKLDLTQRYMLLLPDCEASPVRIPLSEIADYDGRVFVRWKDSLP